MKKFLFSIMLIGFMLIGLNNWVYSQCNSIDWNNHNGRMVDLFGTDTFQINGSEGVNQWIERLLPEGDSVQIRRVRFRAERLGGPLQARIVLKDKNWVTLASRNININTVGWADYNVGITNTWITDTSYIVLRRRNSDTDQVNILFANSPSAAFDNGFFRKGGVLHSIFDTFGVRAQPAFEIRLQAPITADMSIEGSDVNDGDTVQVNVNESVAFTNTSTALHFNHQFSYRWINPGDPVRWEFGDGGTSNDSKSASHTYTSTGVYKVVMLDSVEGYTSGMCIDSIFAYVNVVSGLKTLEVKQVPESFEPHTNVKLYPNPNDGLFFLDLGSGMKEVAIFDMTGRVVYAYKGRAVQLPMDIENPGIYLVKILRGKLMETVKVIVE